MKIMVGEFYLFCKEEHKKGYLLSDPCKIITNGFIDHLNDFINKKTEQAIKAEQG